MKKYKLIAKTFSGLESVLKKEIKRLKGENIQTGKRAVFFEGDLGMIYRANYYLRTALRVLLEIDFFTFKNTEQFYLRCKSIRWEKYFNENQSFIVNSTVINSKDFNNSMYASLKVKDAIADHFRETKGKRPNVDTENPDIYINVHIYNDKCTLSLDSSGESLHKRGYRIKQGEAPLNEVLAAGMIFMAGWYGNSDFMDPMCGSGTLPIEASLIAQNLPPGRYRKHFAFENWNNFNSELFENIKHDFTKREFRYKIFASDISASNLLNAQSNARRAMVYKNINFTTSDFKNLDISINNATIIINPPYGERLQINRLESLYEMIGNKLKHYYTEDNNAWILSSSIESLKYIGLKPQKKLDLFNGALKCKYIHYPLFPGKRISS